MTVELLYYDGTWLMDQLLHQRQEFDQPLLNFICAHETGWFTSVRSGYDRTVESNHYPVNLCSDPLPREPNKNSLSDIFHERAKNLWNLSQPLSFMWSGGIDSTSALVALINTNPSWHKDMQIITTVFCLQNENPQFFKDFLQPHNCVAVVEGSTFLSKNYWLSRPLVVTGDCADQLFGFGFVPRLPGKLLTDRSIRDVSIGQVQSMAFDLVQEKYQYLRENQLTGPCLDQFHALPEARDIFMTWFLDFIQRCPISIRDGFDFQWWVAFSTKLQTLRYRAAWLTGDARMADLGRYRAFFDCAPFQRWAIDHHHDKWPGRLPHTYKQPFKDFIYATTCDPVYQQNKGKESTWQHSLPPGVKPNSRIKYLDSSNFVMPRSPNWLPESQLLSILH
jgi:hypothetical protein